MGSAAVSNGTVGSLTTGIISKSADYVMTSSDGYYTVLVDASGAARTITLPAVSTNRGRIIIIKKTDSSANTVTVARAGSDTIDGATSRVMTARYTLFKVQGPDTGTDWAVLDRPLSQSYSTLGNPAATTSVTPVMMGLAFAFTPRTSGRVQILFTCEASNSNATASCFVGAAYGTGTAPLNGVVNPGSGLGGNTGVSATANAKVPFCSGGIVTGLTINTAYWFDLLMYVSAGTGTMINTAGFIIEI